MSWSRSARFSEGRARDLAWMPVLRAFMEDVALPVTEVGKMLEQYAAYRPFRELDDAIGIAQDDWWMTDDRGQKLSFMKMWLDHVGDEPFNLAAEPKAQDYARMDFPVLTATGYFDDDQPGALRYYRGHVNDAPAAAVSQH